MRAQRHIDRRAGAHVIAQNLCDFADRLRTTRRALQQLNHHHGAHSGIHGFVRANQDVEAQTAVIRHHKSHARVRKVAADDLIVTRFLYPHHTGFTAAFAIRTQWLGQNHVAVHAEFHLFRRQVEIVFLSFCAQKAIAITVANDFSTEQIETFWQGITLAAGKTN